MSSQKRSKEDFVLIMLLIFSIGLVVIQSFRLTAMVDYSYMVENSYRIFQGQLPYKDFVLAYPPGTFYILALFFILFGPNNYSVVACVVTGQVITLILSYLLFNKISQNKIVNLLMLCPIALAGHGIVSSVNYDIAETICILISLNIFFQIIQVGKTGNNLQWFLLGVTVALSLLFKQNVAVVFIFSFTIVILYLMYKKNITKKNCLYFVCGNIFVITVILVFMLKLEIAYDIWLQIFQYPSGERDVWKNIFDVIAQFFTINIKAIILCICAYIVGKHFCGWDKNILIDIVGCIALFGPIVIACKGGIMVTDLLLLTCHWHILLFISVLVVAYDVFKNKNINYIVGIIALLLTIASSLVSQGIIGSTYGIYPLLMFLLLFIYENIEGIKKIKKHTLCIIPLAIIVSLFIMVVTEVRMAFIDLSGEQYTSKTKALAGVSAPGHYIENLDNLIEWVNTNMDLQESFVELPGEDPIYFATGREPRLKYFHLNSTMFPYTIEKYKDDCLNEHIDYIFVKTDLQCAGGFIDYEEFSVMIIDKYFFVKKLPGYAIYKCKY